MAGGTESTRARRRPHRPTWIKRPGDAVFKGLAGGAALGIVAIFAGMLVLLGRRSSPALHAFGASFIWSRAWNPPDGLFGAAAFIVGTFGVSLIALAVALPVAIGTGVALALLLPRWLSAPLGIVVELLAAVPSIVFGVWGLAIVAPAVQRWSGGKSFGPSLLTAGLVVAVMVVPIIPAIGRDMMRAVALSQRDAGLALGATPWEVTWKIVLPQARAGILAAAMLGFGRAVGETMAVIMVIGNSTAMPHSIFDSGSTMSTIIANEFGDPSGPLHEASLMEMGFLLLLFSLVFNVAARLVVQRMGKRMAVPT